MPFQECSRMSQREEFCRLALAPEANLSELCRGFGIGRTTGYKWLERYREHGPEGLADRSRRPHVSPGQTPAELEARVLAVRRDHPAWCGRKIHRVLKREGLVPPAISTITEIVRRHGMLDGPRAGERRDWVRFEHAAPNDLWQMDFKGHFALEVGRCHPLTVLDDHSRYSLEIGACGDEATETVQERLVRVFRRYGLPWRMLTDNGPPWGTGGPARYTVLTVWLLDLGIAVSHGRPYHPQTQGKDERFHRTLMAEVLDGRRFRDLNQIQAAFDAWREVYNTHRPHQAIELETPSKRYQVSPRRMPETIAPPDYEAEAETRMVQDTGWISFKGQKISCSKAFAGRRVALRATDTDGLFDLCYRSHVLAQVDLRQNIVQPVHHLPEQVSTMSPV
jgi:transposase InsO family protein